jgi:hypothetical protein
MKQALTIPPMLSRFLILLLMPLATPGAEPEPIPFWKRPKLELPFKLQPAKIELLAGPDLSRPLALFDPDHKVTNPAVFPFVNHDKDQIAYRVIAEGLTKGAKPYSDRHYTVTTLPERFARLPLLQTKMAHKGIVDSRFGIVLSLPKPAWLFLALDDRLLATFERTGVPAWMQDFAPIGEKIGADNPFDKTVDASFHIFAKRCAAGRVTLGACGADPKFNSMYFAFAAELVSETK